MYSISPEAQWLFDGIVASAAQTGEGLVDLDLGEASYGGGPATGRRGGRRLLALPARRGRRDLERRPLLLAPMQQPSGLPCIVLLQPRDHHDLDDLPAELAAELGALMIRIERAIVTALPDIGRVHVCRWGDGSAHFHLWFMARPARLPQLVGSFDAIWDDFLPPLREETWRWNLSAVAEELARSGGTAIA